MTCSHGAPASNPATASAAPLVDATKNGATDSAYLYAGAEGLDEILVMTLRHGADVRSLNRFGGTALIPASEHGHVSTVRLLIDAGVDVNHVDAVAVDRSARAGADPMIRDGSGRTVLGNAERLGQNEIAHILQQHRN
ncbi:ankyrin repeat domain-containing protein [Gordonia sp. ABSL11-1]|uniref:ankyrin repeat domain-containing protein n=1 Tax=Gordonia sp. ABSL11-1 TaxID=3053924 RepID=UPI0025743DD0|nr:ankyrin repeat domain-containing protein [Gordonia sp. ABSL11-1]MDL9948369.1 ankyrin repeat domain-containing protein [Gordonia sp. ABSL11-1]